MNTDFHIEQACNLFCTKTYHLASWFHLYCNMNSESIENNILGSIASYYLLLYEWKEPLRCIIVEYKSNFV